MGTPQLAMRGLKLLPNHFTAPRGGTLVATNCVIPSKDVMEPRRGCPRLPYACGGSGSANPRALYVFNGTQLVWRDTDNKLAYDTGSAFTDLSGTYSPPAPTQVGMKFAELAKSLYFTTSVAPYALPSATGTPRAAGIPRALDFPIFDPNTSGTGSYLTGNPSDVGSWMNPNTSVGYRAVLGFKDANGVIHLGAPSGRLIMQNPADITVGVGGLVRTGGNLVTATVSSHSLRTGDTYKMTSAGEANFANGTKTIGTVTATTFTYSEGGANAASTAPQTFSSGTKTVRVQGLLPTGLTAGQHFVQLYRTLMSPSSGADPQDEHRQVFERFLTATDIANGYFVISDTCPESQFRGPNLYTNPISGQGIDYANTRPPISQDVCVWDSRLWQAQTTDRHRLSFRLIGVGAPSGLQAGDVVCLGPTALIANTNFTITTQWSPSQNLSLTLSMILYVLNGGTTPSGTTFYGFNLDDGSIYPPSILLEEYGIGGSAIYAACSRSSAVSERLPTPAAVTTGGTSRTANVVTMQANAHGFAQGDLIMVAAGLGGVDANFPVGTKTVTQVVDANNFKYAETGSTVGMAGGKVYYAYATTFASSNNPLPLRYSKQLEPESCPLLNYPAGLPDNASVLRIKPLRDKLYIFLKDGDIYQLSGTWPYQVTRFDATAQLLAADTLVEHSGRLYCLTTQGVVAVSDGGVEVLSYDIEPALDPIEALALAAVRQYAFAVSYESERQYQLWLPIGSSAYCAQAYVFNSLTKDWTYWTETGVVSGLVNPSTKKLVLGNNSNTTECTLRVESKTYGRADLCSDATALNGNTGVGATITMSTNALFSRLQAGDYVACWRDFGFGSAAQPWARITNVNSGTATLTFDRAGFGDWFNSFFSPGPITIYKAMPYAVSLVPEFGAAPDAEKQWREAKFHFGFFDVNAPAFSFNSEKNIPGSGSYAASPSAGAWPQYSGTYESTSMPPVVLRVDVPEQVERGVLLYEGFSTNEPLSLWRLYGATTTSEPGSERTGT